MGHVCEKWTKQMEKRLLGREEEGILMDKDASKKKKKLSVKVLIRYKKKMGCYFPYVSKENKDCCRRGNRPVLS